MWEEHGKVSFKARQAPGVTPAGKLCLSFHCEPRSCHLGAQEQAALWHISWKQMVIEYLHPGFQQRSTHRFLTYPHQYQDSIHVL